MIQVVFHETLRLNGIAGSPGVGVGEIMIVGARRRITLRSVSAARIPAEIARFQDAVTRAQQQLETILQQPKAQLGRVEKSILEAYSLMLADPLLAERVAQTVETRQVCAEWALNDAVTEIATELKKSKDRYLSERSRDIESVGELLQDALDDNPQSFPLDGPGAASTQASGVLVARQLAPTQVAALDPRRVAAVVTEKGTVSSHTAIVARALGIPAVVGCAGVVRACIGHKSAIVDGRTGGVILSPSEAELDLGRSKQHARQKALRSLRAKPQQGVVRTRCGQEVVLLANTEFTHEVDFALAEGAAGIGLYRTEFLCTLFGGYPSEEDQYAAYREVLEKAEGRPVTFRTFDVGDDKVFTADPDEPSRNPPLGRRGIRRGLAEPEILKQQLRALLRASMHGDVRVMLPMVTTADELRQARVVFECTRLGLEDAGLFARKSVPLGAMIEVPAAALTAPLIAKEAEFMSIGTNDLVQYTCAVDRTDAQLAQLSSPLQPAILELVERVVQAGREQSRPVSVCGAMASSPSGALLLVALGIRTLSLEASALPTIRELLSRVTVAELGSCLSKVRQAASAERVAMMVEEHFGSLLVDLPDA